jgi:choline dehydrogenase-like flavoprotein
VGQHFRDHGFTYMTIEADSKLQRHVHDVSEEAMKQWLKDQTGPVAENYCPAAMGFFKTKGIENTEEFKALSPSEKAQVAAAGRPNWEFLSNMPPFGPGLDAAKTHSFVIGFMNPLSFGTLTLRSSNPSDSPVIDPKMFSHPFDRRVAIETFKEAMTFLETLGSKYVSAPDDKSDEAIWVSFWHIVYILLEQGRSVRDFYLSCVTAEIYRCDHHGHVARQQQCSNGSTG